MFWYLGRRRWTHRRRVFVGQRRRRRGQGGRLKMTGGTRVSVTQRFENDFSFFRNERIVSVFVIFV